MNDVASHATENRNYHLDIEKVVPEIPPGCIAVRTTLQHHLKANSDHGLS
jgi:hypothetical protein